MSRAKEKVGKRKSVIEKVRICCPGKISALERSKLHAQNLLNKVIPFEIWSTTEKRTESEIKVYWLVVNGLKKITKEGQPEELKCHGRN
ncbi:MAG: hypothetical protein PHG87_01505 [Candidatus Omnitrophica bacterium]|nr:hypothetical protein [Candidatus Omnitrophota bacterium]